MADPGRDHAAHDLELVARAAAGDLAASEAIAARDLLATCPTCAALAVDLRAIAAATRALPSAVLLSSQLRAPRDFRLSPADAARLRPRGIRGLRLRLAELGLDVGTRAQGIGGALVSLGLVGLLVSAGVPALFGANGGGTTELDAAGGTAEDVSTEPAFGPGASQVFALSTDDGHRSSAQGREDTAGAPGTPWAAITAVSIAVAMAGLVLVAIGWRGRRSPPEGT